MVHLAPRGTAVIEAPNAGPLNEGYVSVSLPAGVVGYGVIPLERRRSSRSRSRGATFGRVLNNLDDTNLVTAVAIVNPSPLATVVSISVRDTTGNLIGTSTVPLGANSKTALIMRSLPGLAAMAGHQGSADFTVALGNIAVLGLRADGPAITSIPTADK